MLEIHDSIALKSRKNLSLAITKVREMLSKQSFHCNFVSLLYLSRIICLNVTINFRSEEIANIIPLLSLKILNLIFDALVLSPHFTHSDFH